MGLLGLPQDAAEETGMEHRERSWRAQHAACRCGLLRRCAKAGRLRRLRDGSRTHRHEGGQEVFARSDRIICGCGGEGETNDANDLGLPE